MSKQSLTVDDLAAQKAALSETLRQFIAAEVSKFEQSTGCLIESVDVFTARVNEIGGPSRTLVERVKVDVDL